MGKIPKQAIFYAIGKLMYKFEKILAAYNQLARVSSVNISKCVAANPMMTYALPP